MIATIEGFTLMEIYEAAYVSKFDRSFQAFAGDPLGTLKAIGQGDAMALMKRGHRPLLPAQVTQRMLNDRQWRGEGHDVDALYQHRQIPLAIRYVSPPSSAPTEESDSPGPHGARLLNLAMEAAVSFGQRVSKPNVSPIGYLSPDLASPGFDMHTGTFEGPLVNPASGLPMIGGSMIDVGGNVFGTGPSLFD
ncbi:hypothetical protein [Dyella humicola]|uniref:hypothetical protein n=1 Tax=Dyella humicola TaxID=2992126 RepID=UPI002257DB9A|nr:hypothetical protein [Dyella humicola]